jgi:tetratricopeptide (TPR) repeat protein
MRGRCAHAAQDIRLARTQVREGRHDEAVDTYLVILSRHPVGEQCRASIAQAAAYLAFDLGCFTLAQQLAAAALDETNQWPVPRRQRAAAWLTIGRTKAWLDDEEAATILSGSELPGGWPWTLRPLAKAARAELAARTGNSDTAGEPSPAEAEKRYRSLAGRLRRRTRAIRQVGYTEALLAAKEPEWAAAHFAAAAATLSRSPEVTRWAKRDYHPGSQRAQRVCLAWARAVIGKLHGPADLTQYDAAACLDAIDVLHRLGHHPAAAQAAARLADRAHQAGLRDIVAAAVERVAARRSDSICWYVDGTLVSQWADSVADARRLVAETSLDTAAGDIGWLTVESGARLLTAIETTYTALGDIDAENFRAIRMFAYQSLATHIDRIGLPRLALAASEREVAVLRDLVDTFGDEAREELAWALRRHAICLTDAGITDGVAATWAEAADLHLRFGHVKALARAHQRLTDCHVAAGEWRDAASATALGASRVATMKGEPPLPAIDSALAEIEARAFERNLTATVEELSCERLELSALMAAWDPDNYTTPYVYLLIGRASRHDLPADERRDGLRSALAAARGPTAAQHPEGGELLAKTLTASAAFALDHDLPSEALACTDEVIPHHRAAIAAGQSRQSDLVTALMRRDRCLEELGRDDERAATLTDAYAAVREWRVLRRDLHTKVPDIAARLWDIEATDLAVQVLSDALTWDQVSDFVRTLLYDLRGFYLAHLRRPDEALRDLDSATQLDGNADPFARRGRVLSLIGRHREAREVFARLAASRPSDPYLWRMLGLMRLYSGDAEGAVGDLLEAVRLRPASGVNRIVLAYAYLAVGEVDAALRHAHLAVDLADTSAEAHYVYGVALRIDGDDADGDAELVRAIDLMDGGESPLAGDRYAYRALFEAARGRGRDAVDQLYHGVRIGLTPEMAGYLNTQFQVLDTYLPEMADACAAMRAVIEPASYP